MKTNTEFKRDISIDRCRGVELLLLIVFETIWEIFKGTNVSNYLDHSPDIFTLSSGVITKTRGFYLAPNIKFADVGAVGYIFLISLTIVQSYKRRLQKDGEEKTYKKMCSRYVYMIAIGSILSLLKIAYDEIIYIWPAYIFAILFILFIILFIFYLLFKDARLKQWMHYTMLAIGFYAIIYNSLNTIFLCFGLTEKYFGFWGVLQHIGIAGLITIFTMHKLKNNDTINRFFVGIIILLIFTFFHETTLPFLAKNTLITSNIKLLDIMSDGGIIGGFAYGGLLLICTSVSDIYNLSKKKYFIVSLIFLIICIITTIYIRKSFVALDGSDNLFTAGFSKHLTPNKGSISPTYLLYTITLQQILFILIILFKNVNVKFDILKYVGKNPIIMYIYSLLIIRIFVLLNKYIINTFISTHILILEVVFIILSAIGLLVYLDKKDIIFKI